MSPEPGDFEPDQYESIHPNVRDIPGVGELIGRRVIDITGSDRDEPSPYVMLMFDNGTYLRFWMDEVKGFDIGPEQE